MSVVSLVWLLAIKHCYFRLFIDSAVAVCTFHGWKLIHLLKVSAALPSAAVVETKEMDTMNKNVNSAPSMTELRLLCIPGQVAQDLNGSTSWKLTNLIRGQKLDVNVEKLSDHGSSSQPSSGPSSAAPSPARSRKGGGINLLPEVVSCLSSP